jgi:hypothetical protein
MTSFPDDDGIRRPNFANESYCRPQCSFFSSDGVKVAMRPPQRMVLSDVEGVSLSGCCCIEHSHIWCHGNYLLNVIRTPENALSEKHCPNLSTLPGVFSFLGVF